MLLCCVALYMACVCINSLVNRNHACTSSLADTLMIAASEPDVLSTNVWACLGLALQLCQLCT